MGDARSFTRSQICGDHSPAVPTQEHSALRTLLQASTQSSTPSEDDQSSLWLQVNFTLGREGWGRGGEGSASPLLGEHFQMEDKLV